MVMISWEYRQMIAIPVQVFSWRHAARPRPRFSLVLCHQTLVIGLNKSVISGAWVRNGIRWQ